MTSGVYQYFHTWSDIITEAPRKKKLWVGNFTARKFNSCFYPNKLLKFSFKFLLYVEVKGQGILLVRNPTFVDHQPP